MATASDNSPRQKRILLASVLKPVSDVRMCLKFAHSLSEDYRVAVAGRRVEKPTAGQPTVADKSIDTFPLLPASYSPKDRLVAGFRLLSAAQKYRPHLLIVHAVELLPFACYLKIVYRIKVVYDIRENYYFNILYQNNYQKPWKWLLAGVVRLVELFSYPLINHYILAERCYRQEISFVAKKSTIIENKMLAQTGSPSNRSFPIRLSPKNMHFALVGTLSYTYGIREAINFFMDWQKLGFPCQLSICGHYANKQVATELIGLARANPQVFLQASLQPIAYEKIRSCMEQANMLLLPYPYNRSTAGCIPTKMYECLAMGKPMLVQRNAVWQSVCKQFRAACFIDYQNVNSRLIFDKIENNVFYPNGPDPAAHWNEEQNHLLDLADKLLAN